MFKPKLIFNKLLALVLIGTGAFAVWMEGDGTFLIFALILGVPLLFTKENWTIFEMVEVEEEKEAVISESGLQTTTECRRA